MTIQEDDSASKKRGRKSKGGKLISKSSAEMQPESQIPNIILHLKCSLQDVLEHELKMKHMMKNELVYTPEIPPEIHTYTTSHMDFAQYNDSTALSTSIQQDQHDIAYSKDTISSTNGNICRVCSSSMDTQNLEDNQADSTAGLNMKDINQKLKSLKINLYKNTLQDKKSACFWCTYEFDNQPCYIPKYETDDKIYGYGSFCRPECAVAFLMKENLDDSTKFERYHLLNHIYSKVYDYKKNIKPAPNPYYLLEKYYGNLTIQEYRKLLRTEHLLTVIDKPMSRILPELFEDNDHFILGIYGNNAKPSTAQKNVYKVKRQSEKNAAQNPSKNAIMKERFGLA